MITSCSGDCNRRSKQNYTKLKKIHKTYEFLHEIQILKLIHQIKKSIPKINFFRINWKQNYTKQKILHQMKKYFTPNAKNFTPNI